MTRKERHIRVRARLRGARGLPTTVDMVPPQRVSHGFVNFVLRPRVRASVEELFDQTQEREHREEVAA